MNAAECEKLRTNRFRLIQELKPGLVVDFLVDAGVFNDHHKDQITDERKPDDQNRKLLDLLKMRGANAFQKFVEALEVTKQFELVSLLSDTTTGQANATNVQAHFNAANTVGSSSQPVDNNEAILRKLRPLEENMIKSQIMKNLHPLCEQMNNTEVINCLQQQGVFRQPIVDDIMAEKGRYKQNTVLLANLSQRPKEDQLKFIAILMNTGQEFLAQKLVVGL